MAHETETKVLEVDPAAVAARLEKEGAQKILETTYSVDWFRTKGSGEGDDQWFLRIRSTSDGHATVTWKGMSTVLGDARTHKEIDFEVDDPQKMADLFSEIDLERYAHQDKRRTSWTLKDWRFDLDVYPGIPPYLEIEGADEASVQEAIKLLGLEKHKKYPGGERLLIQETYGKDWYEMRF